MSVGAFDRLVSGRSGPGDARPRQRSPFEPNAGPALGTEPLAEPGSDWSTESGSGERRAASGAATSAPPLDRGSSPGADMAHGSATLAAARRGRDALPTGEPPPALVRAIAAVPALRRADDASGVRSEQRAPRDETFAMDGAPRAEDAPRRVEAVQPVPGAEHAAGIAATEPPMDARSASRLAARSAGQPERPAGDAASRGREGRSEAASRARPAGPALGADDPVRGSGSTSSRALVAATRDRTMDLPTTEPPPTVVVTIGRVEIRASAPAPVAPRRPTRPEPMSLDVYLTQRRRGEGR